MDHENWDLLIGSPLLTYRVSWSPALNESPFFLIFGRDPVLPQDLFTKSLGYSWRDHQEEDASVYKSKQLKLMGDAYRK